MGAAGGMGAAGIVEVLKYVLVTLGGGVALGAVCGLVFAGLKYPNPNKKALFSTKQKIILMVVAVLGTAMIIFAFTKKPGGDKPVGGDMEMNQMVEGPQDDPTTGGDGEGAEQGDEAASGDESGEESESGGESDSASDGADESESSESSSESSSEASSAAAAPSPAIAGGGTIHFAGGSAGSLQIRPR